MSHSNFFLIMYHTFFKDDQLDLDFKNVNIISLIHMWYPNEQGSRSLCVCVYGYKGDVVQILNDRYNIINFRSAQAVGNTLKKRPSLRCMVVYGTCLEKSLNFIRSE